MIRSNFWFVVLTLALGGPSTLGADEPGPPAAKRLVTGRCLDAEGQPARTGRIFLGAADPRKVWTAAWSAPLDADGRFRVELAGYIDPNFEEMVPAVGPLRWLVLAPGCRVESGKIAGGMEPATLELRLTAQVWKETSLQVRNRAGASVADAAVELAFATSEAWATHRTDADGRCRVATPPGQPFTITARSRDSLATIFGMRGAGDEPTQLSVPLREPIRGRVVDADGQPLAGIEIGTSLATDDDAADPALRRHLVMTPIRRGEPVTITDPAGRFTLSPTLRPDSRSLNPAGEFRLRHQPLCFADGKRQRVAFVAVDWQTGPSSYEILLRPARPIQIPITHEVAIASGVIDCWWSLTCLTDTLGTATSLRVLFGLVLPAAGADPRDRSLIAGFWPTGRYQLKINSADPAAHRALEEISTEVVIPAGDGPLDLPAIRMTAIAGQRMVGQPAPEIAAQDLNTGAPVQLADFRGQVVVLDFWGYWCGPCLGAMPGLVALHETFRDQPVVVVALHDQSVQSNAAYHTKLDDVRRRFWNDRDLPFRVALDRPDPTVPAGDPGIARGLTCSRYEIQYFPTTFVIDPDGKVAGMVSALQPGLLEAKVRELLAQKRVQQAGSDGIQK